MNSTARNLLIFAGIAGAAAVLLGALGSHGVSDAAMQRRFEIANRYHFYHTFALAIVALLVSMKYSKLFLISALFFANGLLCFCGVLYYYSLSGNAAFNILNPIGGLSFSGGWLLLAIGAWHSFRGSPGKQ